MGYNFHLLFYLKKPRNYLKDGLIPIYLRITVKGKHAEYSVGRAILPIFWSSLKGRASGQREEVRELNDYLDTLASKVRRFHASLVEKAEEVTAVVLRDHLSGRNSSNHTLLKVYQNHNDNVEKLIGNGYRYGTFQAYQSSMSRVREFIQKKYGLLDINIKKVDFKFITDYELYLRIERKNSPMSARKYMVHLKKIILYCLGNGWIAGNPFINYRSTAKAKPRTFLNMEEMERIKNREFSRKRLNVVRDIFIFSCYTGLSYTDVKQLRLDQISRGDDGNLWIFIKRQKTETPCHIPLLDEAKVILDRYRNHWICRWRKTALPVLTNQRMNSYLKEIADQCAITKVLTYHLARHTFATTITLSNGVPIETVSQMLGHNSLKTTQHYAKVIDTKVSTEMSALQEKLLERNKEEEDADGMKVMKLFR
ncbi:site-specific integrase [Pedobacter miscanthi]|uniref:site-specific integrase n=1 Tax=Pedobacter miscanthi TaxID=2259170 RepID=UPI00293034E4|nr:site-specific integrase [Pedobacter miscanthi]